MGSIKMNLALQVQGAVIAMILVGHCASGFLSTPIPPSPLRGAKATRLSHAPISRHGRGGMEHTGRSAVLGGLSMQKQWGGEDNQKGQEEWRSFSAYNMGRWKGRVLHLSPETGQYVSPFSVSHLVDVMALGEGAQVTHVALCSPFHQSFHHSRT